MRTHLLMGLGAAVVAGCVGIIGDPSPDGAVPEGAELAAVSGARRLTRYEYDNTVRDLLGDTTRPGWAKLPEDALMPFDNDYTTQVESATLIEAAESLAEEVALRALADPAKRAALVPCTPTGADDATCLGAFVAQFGRRALRRPLSQEEIDRYLSLQSFAIERGDFFTGVELVIRAMLQELEFLYRVEVGTPVEGAPGAFRLNGYQLATRLSYFLLGTTPDDALLDLAASGRLDDPAGVREVAASLLADPRARTQVERYHAMWLGYVQLPHPPQLSAAFVQESSALVDRVVFDERADYWQLFRADETYLDAFLANHYGLAPPTDSPWTSYGDSGRRGILSHGSFLSAGMKFGDTSPTQRGIFVRTRLACLTVPPPPPEVDTDVPPGGEQGPIACKADLYEQHATSGSCASCHKLIDPIGLGLERFDGEGRYRTEENGKPECQISGDGNLEGVGAFNGPADLAERLITSGALEPCVVKQLYRFATGRRERREDERLLERLAEAFRSEGHAFDRLLLEMVSSDAFGFRKQDD